MKFSHLIRTTAAILPVLAATLPGHAAAVQAVTLQCDNFALNTKNGTVFQRVLSVNTSAGAALPSTCVPNGSCAQCIGDLSTNGFAPIGSFDTTSIAGSVTPYFVFKN
ncbi:MAG TPA: hypothetical protein VEK34_07555 [Methylocella sp.]|nr:hypothetical protein [Methylocella sp.]